YRTFGSKVMTSSRFWRAVFRVKIANQLRSSVRLDLLGDILRTPCKLLVIRQGLRNPTNSLGELEMLLVQLSRPLSRKMHRNSAVSDVTLVAHAAHGEGSLLFTFTLTIKR